MQEYRYGTVGLDLKSLPPPPSPHTHTQSLNSLKLPLLSPPPFQSLNSLKLLWRFLDCRENGPLWGLHTLPSYHWGGNSTEHSYYILEHPSPNVLKLKVQVIALILSLSGSRMLWLAMQQMKLQLKQQRLAPVELFHYPDSVFCSSLLTGSSKTDLVIATIRIKWGS